jgi:hypothetical protein
MALVIVIAADRVGGAIVPPRVRHGLRMPPLQLVGLVALAIERGDNFIVPGAGRFLGIIVVCHLLALQDLFPSSNCKRGATQRNFYFPVTSELLKTSRPLTSLPTAGCTDDLAVPVAASRLDPHIPPRRW